MDIKITHFVEGAKAATGVAVIIDVFRAFSLECYLVNNHVSKIIPIASKEEAYQLKEKHPDFLLIGERDGIKLPGFDYGNSPWSIAEIDFTGKTVVHTTSAGTQGLHGASRVGEANSRLKMGSTDDESLSDKVQTDVVLTGSLVNAKAIADFIRSNHPNKIITLVSMGWNGVEPAEEDDICAEYIKALLLNRDFNISEVIEKLKHGGGKKFFMPELNHIFPREDFFLCTDVDKFNFVLQYEDGFIKPIFLSF